MFFFIYFYNKRENDKEMHKIWFIVYCSLNISYMYICFDWIFKYIIYIYNSIYALKQIKDYQSQSFLS